MAFSSHANLERHIRLPDNPQLGGFMNNYGWMAGEYFSERNSHKLAGSAWRCFACGFILVMLAVDAVRPARAANCLPPPPGLVAWWPGEGDAKDLIGANDGTLQGGALANAVGE